MDSKDRGSRVGLSAVYAPVTGEPFETEKGDSLVKSLISNSTCLFYAVYALHQFHDLCLFSRCFESGGLFHVDGFRFRGNAMEEGGFDIDVLDVPIEYGRNM